MFVTPRDIDAVVRDAAKLIGYGIDLALHDGLTVADLDLLLSWTGVSRETFPAALDIVSRETSQKFAAAPASG